LAVADNAAGSPQSVPLTGTGTQVQLSPSPVNFGSIGVGHTSAPRTVTLTNVGTSSINVSSVQITGPNSGDFAETNTCHTVGAGQTCTISVTFTPGAQGARQGILNVNDNGGGSPQQDRLLGSGT